MTRPGSVLRGVQTFLRLFDPARVRIWVISTVTAPNKHKSCKSCSSRTGPSVTAKTIGARLNVLDALTKLKLRSSVVFNKFVYCIEYN